MTNLPIFRSSPPIATLAGQDFHASTRENVLAMLQYLLPWGESSARLHSDEKQMRNLIAPQSVQCPGLCAGAAQIRDRKHGDETND